MGRVLDRIGARRGFSFAIVVWSITAMGHALARTVGGFSLARATLGRDDDAGAVGESPPLSADMGLRDRKVAH
jgi:hypothetical protein